MSFNTLKKLDISLNPQTEKKFKDGVIAPDQWKDYPHHHGKTQKIKQYLVASRRCFLEDDYPTSFFNLGVALHYIQDSHTSFASFYPKHHSWEQSIDKSPYVSNLNKTINYYLKDKKAEKKRCLWLYEALSKDAHGKDETLYLATLSGHEQSKSFAKPIIDYNLAIRASFVVTKSILGSKKSPDLIKKLNDELLIYQEFLKTAEVNLSKKIIELVTEREKLQKAKTPSSGLISKIGNWVLSIRIKIKDMSAKSNYNNYQKKKHLDKIIRTYLNGTEKIVKRYKGWYSYNIPPLKKKIVLPELLTLKDVSQRLNKDESELKESLFRCGFMVYTIGKCTFVRRIDLDEFLNSSPMNGFTKYPLQTIECA